MLPARRRTKVSKRFASTIIACFAVTTLSPDALLASALILPKWRAGSPKVQESRCLHSRQHRSQSKLHMKPRIPMHPHANLAVAIDQPILPTKSVGISRLLLSMLLSDTAKTAWIALVVAATLLAIIKSGILFGVLGSLMTVIKGVTLRIADTLKPKKEGVPMTFSDSENDGWGVCTLRSKKKFGKTSFVTYEFDLPKSNFVLPLKLGQQIELCCLDNRGNVAKGDFYVYHPAANPSLGRFSIIAPNKSAMENEYEVGSEASNFVRVLKADLKVGDEIAIKPGDRRLEYRGVHFPVTDMVYLASGTGIVPILEQVRAVLPNGQSSVKSVTVVWMDEDANNFDVIADQLEREYNKYTTKLAVACVVDNMRVNSLADNSGIVNAIPDFIPGTMAVLCGPRPMQRKAVAYLTSRGYPEECICSL